MVQAARVLSAFGLCAILAAPVPAVNYTWTSGTTGGLWSDTTLWTPNSGAGGPTTTDTVRLDTTASDTTRTVTVTSAAAAGVGTLTLTQTNSGTNTLDIGRTAFSVTNAVTLDATNGGVERIFLNPQTGTAGLTTTFTGGLTLNAGGMLSLGAFNPASVGTIHNSNVTGAVTVSGGLFEVVALVRSGTSTDSSASNVNSSFTMTSGTIRIANVATTGRADRRLNFAANASITAGSVLADATSAQVVLSGSSSTFDPDTFDTDRITLSLNRPGDQSVSIGVLANPLVRNTGVKTVTMLAGTQVGSIQLSDDNNGTPGSRTTLRLGSTMTLAAGRSLPTVSGNSRQESGRIDLGIDTNGYLLDLTATNAVWAPGFAGTTVTHAVWNLSGSGTIAANGFNLSANVGANGGVNVGAGLVLDSKSGNGVANVLSTGATGSGTIDPTSTFRYSGTAASATPSTLASTRSIGNLEVTSGALTLITLTGSASNLAVSGGLLNLGTNSRSVATATFSGGTVSSGTLTTYSGGYTGSAAAGATATVSAELSGTGGLVQSGAGTLVLAGSNTYSGGTTITSGTLQIGNDGTAGWIEGNVDNDGTLTFRRSDDVVFSGTIGGTGRLVKSGAGRVTLTAANTFTGDVTIGSGQNSPNYALRLENSEALGPASTVKNVVVTGNNQTSSVLELSAGITVDATKTLLTTGHTYFESASSTQGTPVFLRNSSGSNAWLGNVIINGGGGSYSIESAAGTLVLGEQGTTSFLRNEVASSTRVFEFRGPGNTVVHSRLTNVTTSTANTGLNMLGTGTLTIARTDNDFAFVPSLSVGTTRIASLAHSTLASSLGTGTSFNVGGTLEHIGGVNSSSNRGIGLLGASPTIIAGGTGTLALTATTAISYQDPTSVLAYTYSSGATTLVARDAAGILPGFTITGTGIAPGTTITAVNYDTRVITLSQATTAGSTSVTLTLGGQTDVPRTFVLGGTNTGANTFALRLVDKAASTAPLSLSKTGAGVWAITGSNGFTGATTVEAGTLRIGDGGTAGSIGTTSGIDVAAGALLAFNRTDTYGGAFDRIVSGSGDVRVESGFLNMTAAGTYTGNTTVLAGGTLAVNGSLANAALTVDVGAVLLGSGTIAGSTTIQGNHRPGNSPGVETFQDLTYSGSAAEVTWELWNNTETNSPLAFDQVVVAGSLTFGDVTDLTLVFTGSASTVDWANPFWDTNRQWLIYDVGGTTTNYLNLAIMMQNWADADGTPFDSVRPGATFSIAKDTVSDDVFLVYTAAVPEPDTLALAGLGLAAAGWLHRCRRFSPARPARPGPRRGSPRARRRAT